MMNILNLLKIMFHHRQIGYIPIAPQIKHGARCQIDVLQIVARLGARPDCQITPAKLLSDYLRPSNFFSNSYFEYLIRFAIFHKPIRRSLDCLIVWSLDER